MGPMYLSAALKSNGHECRILVGGSFSDLETEVAAYRPDLVAFSVMTGTQGWALDTGRAVKRLLPGCKVVFGGPHPTFFPEVIEAEGVDIVCRGEGEGALVDLAFAADSGEDVASIANLWFKLPDGSVVKNEVRPLRGDLDTLPDPDRELYAAYPGFASSTVKTVMTSRGCPYDCTFCFNHQMVELYRGKGRYVRHRSPGRVIEEILALKGKGGVDRIHFADDTFALDRNWLLEFLPRYRDSVALPFHCLIRINQLDAKIASLLKESGCRTVFFGIESGDHSIRNSLLRKEISDREIREGAALLKEHGITFRTYNIVGFPGETLEQALKTVRLNVEIGTDFPWCSIFTPYPGTKLEAFAREHGYCGENVTADSLPASFFVSSALKGPEQDRLVNLHKFFQTVVLFPPALPLVKLLVRLPPNPLFRLWFCLVYFLVFLRSEGRGFSWGVRTALNNSRFVRKR